MMIGCDGFGVFSCDCFQYLCCTVCRPCGHFGDAGFNAVNVWYLASLLVLELQRDALFSVVRVLLLFSVVWVLLVLASLQLYIHTSLQEPIVLLCEERGRGEARTCSTSAAMYIYIYIYIQLLGVPMCLSSSELLNSCCVFCGTHVLVVAAAHNFVSCGPRGTVLHNQVLLLHCWCCTRYAFCCDTRACCAFFCCCLGIFCCVCHFCLPVVVSSLGSSFIQDARSTAVHLSKAFSPRHMLPQYAYLYKTKRLTILLTSTESHRR